MVTASTATWSGSNLGLTRLLACSLLAATVVLFSAQQGRAAPPPSAAAILNFKPKQENISYSTPEANRYSDCKVELVKGRGKGSGWLLRDPEGKPLRLLFDANDDNKLDIWSYYKDGVEVYREIDSDFTANKHNGMPDQYRWLNSAGSKWGVDENRDGKIDAWKMISPEEVGQEVLAAVAAKDYERFKTVLISDADLKALDLPADTAARIKESAAKAEARFGEVCAKVSIGAKPTWIHMETGVPQCLPADRAGGRYDVMRHPRGTILYEANGKNDWLQTGEMIQVGLAWRVTDAPTPGAATIDPDPMVKGGKIGTALDNNPRLAKLVEELTGIDKAFVAGENNPAATAKHHLRRADILERIVGEVKPEEREPWIRQVADSLGTAAQSGEDSGLSRLMSLEQQLVAAMPGHNLTAYVTFREMQADYARKIAAGGDFAKTQQSWLDRLSKFVGTYSKAEDTPDALLQCGMVSEFLNKDVEAKNWYGQLVKSFPDKPQAVKAAGAIRRLDLDGKPLKLAGALVSDPGSNFDIEKLAGKVVIVYYWASWNSQAVGDFAKLKLILDNYAGKVELLGINLDNTADEAQKYLARAPAPGTHLHQPAGLEGKLATDYGVMVLPNMFLVGKDGKVVNKSVQVSNVEDEVKKLAK